MLALEINLKWDWDLRFRISDLGTLQLYNSIIQQLQTSQRHENGGLSTIDRGLYIRITTITYTSAICCSLQ